MPSVKRPHRERQRTYLKEWRDYRGRRQNEVADLLEIAPSTLSRLEAGKTPYDQDVLEKLSVIYGCDPEDLISINPNHTAAMTEVVKALRNADDETRKRALSILEVFLKSA